MVFTGHPSLRCGDAVHFMEEWGSNSNNAVIFTGKDYTTILIILMLELESIHFNVLLQLKVVILHVFCVINYLT